MLMLPFFVFTKNEISSSRLISKSLLPYVCRAVSRTTPSSTISQPLQYLTDPTPILLALAHPHLSFFPVGGGHLQKGLATLTPVDDDFLFSNEDRSFLHARCLLFIFRFFYCFWVVSHLRPDDLEPPLPPSV